MAMAMTKMLLPIPDAAMALGIGVTKCWELIAAGDLETVRIGRRRLVPVSALEKYVHDLEQAVRDAGVGV